MAMSQPDDDADDQSASNSNCNDNIGSSTKAVMMRSGEKGGSTATINSERNIGTATAFEIPTRKGQQKQRQRQQQHYFTHQHSIYRPLINGTGQQQQQLGQEKEGAAEQHHSFAAEVDAARKNGDRMWNRQGVLLTAFLTFLLLTGCMTVFSSLLDQSSPNNNNNDDNAFENWTNEDAKNYLDQFGYIGESSAVPVEQAGGHLMRAQPASTDHRTADRLLEDFSLDSLKSAIRRFQEFAGLPATGELDNRTKKKMKQPRCGLQDVLMLRGRGESNSVFKWRKRHLTYAIDSFSSDLPHYMQKKAVQMAFDTWAKHVPLDFSEASAYQQPDIRVRFARRSHGDPWPFDGRGGVLAHATFPSDGQLHFDDDEQWAFMDAAKISSYRYTDLFWVALHEIGHVLGLSHSKVETAIMAPFYRDADEMVDWRGNYKSPELTGDDIRAAKAIYGQRSNNRNDIGQEGNERSSDRQRRPTTNNKGNRNNAGNGGTYDDRQGGFWNRLGQFLSGQNDDEEDNNDGERGGGERQQQQPAGHWRSRTRNGGDNREEEEDEAGHHRTSGCSGRKCGSDWNNEEEEEEGMLGGFFSSAATCTTKTVPIVLAAILLPILQMALLPMMQLF